MQSGISASKELHEAFNKLVSDSSLRGLLAGIDKEQLVPTTTIPSISSDFSTDIAALKDLVKDNEAAYIILRRYPNAPDEFVVITYVPDTANVRSKMLVASTRLTLVRELGSDKFRESIFATAKTELTGEGLKAHDAHVSQKAPLTEEEQSLQSLKAAEAEASTGTSSRSSRVVGVHMPVSQAAQDVLNSFKVGSDTLVQLNIDIINETIGLVGSSKVTADALGTSISNKEPRYSFFKYETKIGSGRSTPIIFIFTCPEESKVKERMVYATSRLAVYRIGEIEYGLNIVKRIEATSPSEITARYLDEELSPQKDEKPSFSRPKRPGRN
ncbi:MAG: Twinfilin-1 [Vezdaea aestivalis]|nr:MAG: Twinfilin-1 [Vezdaea aestivalis]